MEPRGQEHLTIGEFSRWAIDDRAWKQEMTRTMVDHGERLAGLEALKQSADNAESSASSAKKWAWMSGPIGAVATGIIYALTSYFGGGSTK